MDAQLPSALISLGSKVMDRMLRQSIVGPTGLTDEANWAAVVIEDVLVGKSDLTLRKRVRKLNPRTRMPYTSADWQ